MKWLVIYPDGDFAIYDDYMDAEAAKGEYPCAIVLSEYEVEMLHEVIHREFVK